MSKQTKEDHNDALVGANAVIDHLASTGTGKEKLDITREVLGDTGEAATKEDGAKLVVTHLRRRGVNETTIGKAQAFIDAGLKADPPAPAPVFVPGATGPGALPQSVVPIVSKK